MLCSSSRIQIIVLYCMCSEWRQLENGPKENYNTMYLLVCTHFDHRSRRPSPTFRAASTSPKLSERPESLRPAETERLLLHRGSFASAPLDMPTGSARQSPYELLARVYEMSYVIEQVGTEKSRLTLYSREDIRGKSPEWYSNNWDFICARHILAIKDSFIRFPASRDSPNPFNQSPLEPVQGSSVSRQFSAPDPDSAHLNPSNPPSFLEKSPKIFGNYFK